jgi:hypothetical protein
MADASAVDEYIAPLSQSWSDAVERFLYTNQNILPRNHAQRGLLQTAKEQLQDGQMISDALMWAYTELLHSMPISTAACYMDTMALQSLRSSKQTPGTEPKFSRTLKRVESGAIVAHVFWPIHHDGLPHWSLVHLDIIQETTTSYDSLASVGEERTSIAIDEIHEYWLNHHVQAPRKSHWEKFPSDWNQYPAVQAPNSNDCGVLTLLLMRLLRQSRGVSLLPQSASRRQDVMRWVGRRMRRRIVAEIIAGEINPHDELIPEWLWSGSGAAGMR